MVYLSMSLQMFGVLLGAPIFGQISDLFGRKKVITSSYVSIILFHLPETRNSFDHCKVYLVDLIMVYNTPKCITTHPLE